MAKAVRYHKQGGPEVLQVEEVPVGEPGPGQARVRHKAIGVNFVDTYQRSGLYPMQVPAIAGNEGAGVVEAVPVATSVTPSFRSPFPRGFRCSRFRMSCCSPRPIFPCISLSRATAPWSQMRR